MSETPVGKRKNSVRSPQTDFDPASKMTRLNNGSNDTDMDMSFDICERMTKTMDDMKTKVGITVACMETSKDPTPNELKNWMMTLAKAHLMGLDKMANFVGEVVTEMDKLNGEIRKRDTVIRDLEVNVADQDQKVVAVMKAKDKVEIKASSKEMEERLKVANTQFKIMEVEIGKETDNRKEIIDKGMAELTKKVRSDMQKEWTELTRGVDVAPLVRKTVKPAGREAYSAPLLFTVQEKQKKWRMEEILRSSRIYPGYHWPQEMMGVLKEYKNVLKESGVNEETTYIRIRPNERDGKIRLRADIKPKEGNGRFSARAVWDAPPLCGDLRKLAKDHLKPAWVGGAPKE
jgi:hypothetical protein